VVFDHLTYSVFQPVRNSVYHWFDPGQYGVFVFFLVSGYIVPASLERKGLGRRVARWLDARFGPDVPRLRPPRRRRPEAAGQLAGQADGLAVRRRSPMAPSGFSRDPAS
jgi:hypothetical protein